MEKLPDPNNNSLSFTTEVDTLKIKLKKGNHNLTIEAEEKELTKLWSRTISDSEAKSLTKDTFLNSEELFLGLQSAFTEKSSDVTIKVSKTGSIHYCLVVPFKGFKRTYEFNIDLKEVEEDEVSKLKRIVQALSARCKHLEEIVEGKSNSPTKSPTKDGNVSNITHTPSIISNTHQRLFLAFDTKTAHASHFTYLNNDKKLKNLTDDGFWYTCFTKNAIPAKGKHYFEVRFTGKGSFMIGVGKASAKQDTKPGQYNLKSCISYYSSNGGVYENGTARLGGCLLMSGDAVTVKVDMENLIMSWELGGVTLSHARISKDGLSDDRDNLYPCVHLYDNGDECELV